MNKESNYVRFEVFTAVTMKELSSGMLRTAVSEEWIASISVT
jgi:hypothetical protein